MRRTSARSYRRRAGGRSKIEKGKKCIVDSMMEREPVENYVQKWGNMTSVC